MKEILNKSKGINRLLASPRGCISYVHIHKAYHKSAIVIVATHENV